jgi:hypothetical protein
MQKKRGEKSPVFVPDDHDRRLEASEILQNERTRRPAREQLDTEHRGIQEKQTRDSRRRRHPTPRRGPARLAPVRHDASKESFARLRERVARQKMDETPLDRAAQQRIVRLEA